MKTYDLQNALNKKYSGDEWVCYFEVANSTGTRIKRHADCVAMSIWPSRGYSIHGHEIKVSRQDFLKEIADPSKADAVGQFCDYWWLVVPNGLVVPEEIPETWGLMVLQKNGLRVKKQASKNMNPTPVDRGFMSAMLRRGKGLEKAHIQKAIEEGEELRRKDMERSVVARTKHIQAEMENLRNWKAEFESVFNQPLHTWEKPDKLAEKLKMVERLDSLETVYGLEQAAKNFLKAFEQYKDEKND